MKNSISVLAVSAAFLAISSAALADDQSKAGSGNALSLAQVEKAAIVQSARSFILDTLQRVGDKNLRDLTRDAIDNAKSCVTHRAGMTAISRQEIFDKLKAEGLIDIGDEGKISGGLINGVFPPLVDDNTACPKLPQTYWSAPGGAYGGHHSEPGGLPVHVSFNLSSNLSLAENYRRIYGQSRRGVPVVTQAGQKSPGVKGSDILISEDITILAPIWHDWAKTMVFQWNADGSEFAELNIGGNGKTDNGGATGDSKTGAHHIIGIAEVMKRGFPAEYIVTHASAHSVPTGGAEYKVVNWIRTAAMLANIDPVAKGYLVKDKLGKLRLAEMREMKTVAMQEILPNEPHLLVEYVLHNISDSDYTYTGAATAEAQVVLKILAAKFGYDPNDGATYNTKYRNPVLTHLSAERIQILYTGKGLAAVETEIARLKKMGVI